MGTMHIKITKKLEFSSSNDASANLLSSHKFDGVVVNYKYSNKQSMYSDVSTSTQYPLTNP